MTGLCLAALTNLAEADDAAPTSTASTPTAWPDTPVARLQAFALLQSLNADLLSHDSATLTLDRWCDTHRLAAPAKVTAELDRRTMKAATNEQRKLLHVGAAVPLRYRHVRLVCGNHVLSEADNWYVPARLTAEMNHQLETTDIAFGRAVQALHFQRHTLSANLLWLPLPAGWEMGAPVQAARTSSLQIPPDVLQHQAVLTLPDATPFSLVVETYTNAIFAFPPPPQP